MIEAGRISTPRPCPEAERRHTRPSLVPPHLTSGRQVARLRHRAGARYHAGVCPRARAHLVYLAVPIGRADGRPVTGAQRSVELVRAIRWTACAGGSPSVTLGPSAQAGARVHGVRGEATRSARQCAKLTQHGQAVPNDPMLCQLPVAHSVDVDVFSREAARCVNRQSAELRRPVGTGPSDPDRHAVAVDHDV